MGGWPAVRADRGRDARPGYSARPGADSRVGRRRTAGARCLVPDLGTAPRENDDTIRLRLYEAAHCSISQQLKELLGQRSRWCGRPRARRNIIAGRALHDRLVFAGSAVDIGRRTATVGDIVETTERQPVPVKESFFIST